jgi:hypothetical protein
MKSHTISQKSILSLIFLFTTVPYLLYAQWSARTLLSPNAISASLNENMATCLAVGGDTVHVVWSDQRPAGTAIYYKRSFDLGTTWNVDTPITDTTGSATFPAISVSGSTVHVVWMDTSLGHRASFYKRSLDGGNTWGQTFCLDSITAFWPGLSSSGTMVVVSLNKQVAVGNTEVFFRRSMDNGVTWDAEQRISNAIGRSEDPAISALGTDIHLVWNDERTGIMQIYYRHSKDAGVTWGPETQLTNATGSDACYSTMVSLDGPNTDVPYGYSKNGNFDVWLTQSADTGATWVANNRLTFPPVTEAYPYLARNGLNLHLVYPQIVSGGGSVWYLHSADGGANWDSTLMLGAGGQPFIAITGCVLHVIWTDSGSVYYKNNPTGNCGIGAGVSSLNVEAGCEAKLFPNPGDGHFTLSYCLPVQQKEYAEGISLRIMDVIGRVVYSTFISATNNKGKSSVVPIDAANLSNGIYYWQLTTESGSLSNGQMAVMK